MGEKTTESDRYGRSAETRHGKRRVVVGGGAVTQLAVAVVPPALDRAGNLLTTTLSEPALHQIASAISFRLASLHVDELVLVIPQGVRSHACL